MSWWKYAKPGDKVVCIAEPSSGVQDMLKAHGVPFPRKGEVVTVDQFETATWGEIVFCSVEYPPRESPYGEVWSDCDCFRPVQKKSTEAGLAALRKHLNTKEVPEHA